MNTDISKLIEDNATLLADNSFLRKGESPLPSIAVINLIIDHLWEAMFPGYHTENVISSLTIKHRIAIKLEKALYLLKEQIDNALAFENKCSDGKALCAEEATKDFISTIPQIKRLIITDVEAIFKADPAATSLGEVIFSYPSVVVMVHHRIAHELHKLGIPIIPRIISEIAHSKTGIDIHPGAQIGGHFAIDHGTGIVIGETTVIGEHVVIYQGVTLGAKSFRRDEEGFIINEPRHPIIHNNVTIYANASILGRITIGEGSIIGSNTCVMNSIPPYSRMTRPQI